MPKATRFKYLALDLFKIN